MLASGSERQNRRCCVSGAVTPPRPTTLLPPPPHTPPLFLTAGYFYGRHLFGVPAHLHEEGHALLINGRAKRIHHLAGDNLLCALYLAQPRYC